MSNVFFILLLAVVFAGWKALDHFQLPNTFSILLLILTALSGILWCYHRFAVMPRRRRQIARAEQRSGKALTDEEKQKVQNLFLRFSLCYQWCFLYVHLFLSHFKFHQDQWKQHCV